MKNSIQTGTAWLVTMLISIGAQAQWTDIYNNKKVVNTNGYQHEQRILSDLQGGCYIVWQDARDQVNIDQIYAQHYDSLGNASWPENGKALAPTGLLQKDLQVVPDGVGGFIAIWADSRDTSTPLVTGRDIYGQRMSRDGSPMWGATGKGLIVEAGEQSELLAVTDGNGGVIFAFGDGGNFQAGRSQGYWMQRVNNTGAAVWTSGGMLIHKRSNAFHPSNDWDMSTDGAGGAVLVFDGSNLDINQGVNIYAHRIDSSGNRHWIPDYDTLAGIVFERGYPISKMQGAEDQPKIETDPSGNIFVCWSDKRNSTWKNGALYAQKLNRNGEKFWGDEGLEITHMSGHGVSDFDLESDGMGGLYFLHTAGAVNKYQIVRYDSSGQRLWLPRTVNEDVTYTSNLCRSHTGGVWVAWNETTINPGSEAGIVAQKYDLDGNALINGNALLCSYPEDKNTLSIACDQQDALFCVWADYRRTNGMGGSNADQDLYAQRYTRKMSSGIGKELNAVAFRIGTGSDALIVHRQSVDPIALHWKIIDVQGRVCDSGVWMGVEKQLSIPVSGLGGGVYLLNLTGNGHVQNHRFVRNGFTF